MQMETKDNIFWKFSQSSLKNRLRGVFSTFYLFYPPSTGLGQIVAELLKIAIGKVSTALGIKPGPKTSSEQN